MTKEYSNYLCEIKRLTQIEENDSINQIPEIIDNSKEIEEVRQEKEKIEDKNGIWILWCVTVVILILGIIAIVVAKKRKKKFKHI